MKIFVYDTYDKLSQVAANFVAAQLLKNPSSHIGLTLGNTPARSMSPTRITSAAACRGIGRLTRPVSRRLMDIPMR